MINLSMVSVAMTQKGVTALYFASQEGHVTVVRLLLGKGADVNICDKVVMDFASCTRMCKFSQLDMYAFNLQKIVCRLTTQTLLSY